MIIFTVLKDHFCKGKESEGWTFEHNEGRENPGFWDEQSSWMVVRRGVWDWEQVCRTGKEVGLFLNVELQGLWHTEMEVKCGQMSQERNLGCRDRSGTPLHEGDSPERTRSMQREE